MSTSRILVVGSLNMDQVVRVPRLPKIGETILGAGSLQLVPGGKGGNQAVAIARLGGRVSLAGRVGQDLFGERLTKAVQADDVETSLLAIDSKETSGVAFIFLTPESDNAIVVAAGANMQVGKDQQQMQKIIRAIGQSSMLVLQMEIPLETVTALIKEAHQAKVPVMLNLAPAHALPKETLQQLSILVVNESEASLLSGQKVESIEDAQIVATVLHERGIETVVVTLGPNGALLVTRSGQNKPLSIHHPSPRVTVQDTTAAGDCFVGALAVALNEQLEPAKALRFAIAAGTLKVTRFGAQSGLPTRTEVDAFMRSH